jgi:putative ATPase
VNPPRFYEPVPRGLELQIGERLEELRRLNDETKTGVSPVASKKTR